MGEHFERAAFDRLTTLYVTGAHEFALHHYAAPPRIEVVLQPGYWNSLARWLHVGNRIMVTGPEGAIDLHVARSHDGVVTVAMVARTALVADGYV